MNLADITPVLITKDEEANIRRTLAQLQWAAEVIVVDSGSTDATLAIARDFSNVRTFERALDDLASQWTFAAMQARTPWILTLDADYFVPGSFVRELEGLEPADAAAFEASFTYAVNGTPLRATLYTPRPVLLRRNRSSFFMDGHTQRARITGHAGSLKTRLIHDDRKSLRRFIERQQRYMRDEAGKLRAAAPGTLNAAGRVRKLRVFAPLLILPYVLFAKGLILDGRAGWRYAFERFLAELMLSIELFRR
jgi:glycosyltransferase involved in cell wall biosynthesis